MSNPANNDTTTKIDACIKEVLSVIEQDREREIITRRFGLYGHKETLEQIGELLGITRERVRQLEKAILNKLKNAVESGKITMIDEIEKDFVRELSEMGRVAKIQSLADKLVGKTADAIICARVAFIAALSKKLVVIDQNDNYYQSIGIKEYGDDKSIKSDIDSIVSAVRKFGKPLTVEELHKQLTFEQPLFITAFASLSKLLAYLNGNWGLTKWPTVNPKNIRDKIFVILDQNNSPMHFSEIASQIQDSDFKRKDVTTQAIHNELIKDSRFVLIGRGIYALNTWGFTQGTVADIIANVLKESPDPLHRDEIVRRVLEKRQVKETTILLNLQSKPQFKRVSKATYTLAE